MNVRENTGGYESMAWLQERAGKQFSCYLEDIKDSENLTEEEKAHCLDVDTIIGTKRW